MVSDNSRTLIKGLAVVFGEIALGVNGPFLFGRFGFYVPVAVATAVILGAAVAYVITSVALRARRKEPVATPLLGVRQKSHRRVALGAASFVHWLDLWRIVNTPYCRTPLAGDSVRQASKVKP